MFVLTRIQGQLAYIGTLTGQDVLQLRMQTPLESLADLKRFATETLSEADFVPHHLQFKSEYHVLSGGSDVVLQPGTLSQEACEIVLNLRWQQDVNQMDTGLQVQWEPTSLSLTRMALQVTLVHGSRDLENHRESNLLLRELINLDKLDQMRRGKRSLEQWFGSTGLNTGASAEIMQFIESTFFLSAFCISI